MLSLDAILTACVILLVSLTGANAQLEAQFVWGFTTLVSTSLPSCQTFAITLEPITAPGVPPFYMIAYAVGGAPITSFIGTNESDLSWRVTHPIGTQLLLGVVDSKGNTGGIDVPLYTVTQGSSTACIPPPPPPAESPSAFSVTANVTDTLTTCQPWGLTVRGGIRPYNVTLVALNSTVVTNVTMGADDSVFTYINRQAPNSQLLAAVNDLDGNWATGSPVVHTTGSADLTCRGLDSTSSNGTASSPQAGNNGGAKSHLSHGKIGAIVGAIVGALLLLGVATWIWRRRQQHIAQKRRPRVDIDPFEEDRGPGPNTTDVWDNSTQPHPSMLLVSTDAGRSLGTKESRLMATGLLAPTSERSSSSNTTPLASPHMGVHELPPSLPSTSSSPSPSRRLASKEGRSTATGSLAQTSETYSSTNTTPLASPHVFVHELPPPYVSPRLGEQ